MSVVQSINEKIGHLPLRAQEEVLDYVERIEERYANEPANGNANGSGTKHVLDLIAESAIDGLPSDFSQRHDSYAHAKLEN